MTDLILPRRKFLTGLMGLVAAPAVAKATSLMPVKVIEPKWFANDGTGLVSMAHPIELEFTTEDIPFITMERFTLVYVNEKAYWKERANSGQYIYWSRGL